MPSVLLATDADWIYDEVSAALAGGDTTVSRVRHGRDVIPVMPELAPDLVILDLQIGNMGGPAVCRDIKLDAEAGRVPEAPVLLLLDRDADIFLATEAGADGWLIKPIDALRLRRAQLALVEGGRYTEGLAGEPPGSGADPSRVEGVQPGSPTPG